MLASRYELRQVCTVRHPLDQWLSLSQLAVMQGRIDLATFLAGYRRFAESRRPSASSATRISPPIRRR
jgi:hypothetical protein